MREGCGYEKAGYDTAEDRPPRHDRLLHGDQHRYELPGYRAVPVECGGLFLHGFDDLYRIPWCTSVDMGTTIE
ncbi:hypothetical protein D3C73_1424590 [compost metagenome]